VPSAPVAPGRRVSSVCIWPLAHLKALRTELVEPLIAEYQGRVVKLMGDGLLAEFASIVDAARCAVLVQRGVAEREADVPEAERICFRIGVNLGDVIHEADGDLYGDGVNVAARLEQLAAPGGVVISGTAFDHLRGELGCTFASLGEQHLKNIERPVRAYRMILGGGGGPPERPALPVPDKPSLAVLPFDNLSGDPEQGYFADGIVEDITTALARLRGLFVIARNSSFAYKGRAVDVREVGRELGVRYVLEGSVRRGGQRLRITAQLVEAATGRHHLWAERYDGTSEDVFDLQDRITADVVGAIEPSVQRAEIERARRKRPDSLDAYDRYLRALPHAWANTPGEAEKALAPLGEALALDPDYAAAHGLAAWCYRQRLRRTRDPSDREAALRHARAALAAGADEPMALTLGALVVALLDHDYTTALGAVERAVAINPSSATGWGVAALVNAFSGNYAATLDQAARSARLSPLDPLRYHAEIAVSFAEFFGGRFEQAAQAAARTVQVAPRFPFGHAMLAVSLLRAGRAEEAREAARRLLATEPAFRSDEMRVIGHPDPAEVDRLCATLTETGVPE
jgi:TolB-like protein